MEDNRKEVGAVCWGGQRKGAFLELKFTKWEGVAQGKSLYWKEAQDSNPGDWKNLVMFMKVKEKERQVWWQFGGKVIETSMSWGQEARRTWIRQGVVGYEKELGCILSQTGIHELWITLCLNRFSFLLDWGWVLPIVILLASSMTNV